MVEAVDGDRTDWNHVRTLSDEDIDRAISTDSDTFALRGLTSSSHVRFVVSQSKRGGWLWRMVTDEGEVIAHGRSAFPSRTSALAAMEDLRRTISRSSDVIAA